MFNCEQLTCRREERILFKELGFALAPGGLLLLKGANGSGKTTLLRTLAGLRAPSAGRIMWKGEPIRGNPDFAGAVMMIGHSNGIKEELTVRDNIYFWAVLRGTEMLLPAALHYFGLEALADVPCFELSAGWKRRVALARLIVAPAPLWLLDEPGNFLDQEAMLLLSALVETRVKQQGMVIIATHAGAQAEGAQVIDLGAYAPQEAYAE